MKPFSIKSLFNSFISNDIAIDLGTASTLIYMKNEGIVLNEPSVVAIDLKTNKPLAIGFQAKEMLGKTPQEIKAVRPMKDGVIADFEVVEEMLRYFITKVEKSKIIIRPRVIVCVPSGITAVEMRAVRDSVEHSGVRDVFLVSEPVAAAVGVGLPVEKPKGSMVIDIGGGTSEIAVIALNGIVTNNSIRVGGDEMDESIIQYVKKNYNLLIGEQTTEKIKTTIGSAYKLEEELELEIKGIDLVEGIPKTIKLTSEEIRDALREPVYMIVSAIKQTLEKTPPELASDIIDQGIVMTGGGSLLKNFDKLVSKETGLKVTIPENPIECVVKGSGKILENLSFYEKIIIQTSR
ncbi:MAG: Rod shape-determining protein MreB [candidate division TA06 bacterium 32_111]|uniref:Cell shape-determining protein MreB n=1 Tax=candidate division TA06 bacterium 34_109 TaxID=1635277 RepID=A0A101I3I5_UNCT6|nr:MAG: Rod shape-determining protein MreB [candidate division TA06 bacterium 32_111]KUK88111.1 MAG: Rod shape-determining protein MreB [candidate division TA06 bacterium 34_109]